MASSLLFSIPACPRPGLRSAAIVNLHLDHSGRMWVSTDRGLVVQEGKNWRSYGTNEGWAGVTRVRTFAERADGDLLMTTFDGHVLEFVDGRFKDLPPLPGRQARVTSLTQTKGASGGWSSTDSSAAGTASAG